jgi:hypothetical protein
LPGTRMFPVLGTSQRYSSIFFKVIVMLFCFYPISHHGGNFFH